MWRYRKGNNRNCCVLTLPGFGAQLNNKGDTSFGVPLPKKRTPGTLHRPNPNSGPNDARPSKRSHTAVPYKVRSLSHPLRSLACTFSRFLFLFRNQILLIAAFLTRRIHHGRYRRKGHAATTTCVQQRPPRESRSLPSTTIAPSAAILGSLPHTRDFF